MIQRLFDGESESEVDSLQQEIAEAVKVLAMERYWDKEELESSLRPEAAKFTPGGTSL